MAAVLGDGNAAGVQTADSVDGLVQLHMGVTGQEADFHKNVSEYLKEVKKTSSTGTKPGSLIAKANLVKDYNDRNNKNYFR